MAVRAYGEAEFWLSGGKVILIFMLFSFTFVTMVGGNPQGDAYGFRYWNNPGAFAEYLSSGSLGRFEGFLAAMWSASFTVVGPEYIAMVAAEAKRPRIYIKNAFKTVYVRFAIFFIGGSLAVGIVCASNDPTLEEILNGAGGGGTAAASPYVIAMSNLGIGVLPHITNALMLTSIFSAGNTYTYCATRTLYGLALEGRAPKFLRKCTKSGVPLYCFCIVICFSFLSFLQVSNGASTVLTWLVNLVTAGGIIDFIVMCVTYICFYRACQAQGLDRKTLPYVGWFQPWCGWIGLTWMTLIVFTYGYSSFKPAWSVDSFFSYYTMLGVAPILFVFWKVFKKTKFVKPHEADLVWERPIVDAYEASFTSPPVTFWTEMLQLVGLRRSKIDNYRRDGSISG
jgi:yeast amino acid transporter